MGLFSRFGTDADMNQRRPANGRTAREVENLAQERGSTVRKVGDSYVEIRDTGGAHGHRPNGDGTYSCACGC